MKLKVLFRGIKNATAVLEIDTAHDRDATAIEDRALENPNDDDNPEIYKGQAGYTTFFEKGEKKSQHARASGIK